MWGVNAAVYEVSYGYASGSAKPTQLQTNQITGSVGMALTTTEHMLLMQSAAHVPGPINEFALTDFQCNGYINNTCFTAWEASRYMAAGPGQLATWTDVPAPIAISLGVVNSAIGSNRDLLTVTQSGTPLLNYAGGQGGSILPNSSVPLVYCTAYTNGLSDVTTICFNNSARSQGVTFTGPDAPTSSTSVIKTVFGGPTNTVTDNNAKSYIGNNSTPPVVATPSPSTRTGLNVDTLPAQSMTTYVYKVGSTSEAATPTFSPAAGTYAKTQSVTISDATSGATIYYTRDGSMPTTASTLYSGPISVAASETVKAIATASGYSNFAVATAAYTITAATPSFSPVAGTYSSTQDVGLGCGSPTPTEYYTTDGSTPTTSSTKFTQRIVVSTSTTIKAICTSPGLATSAVASAAYVISQ